MVLEQELGRDMTVSRPGKLEPTARLDQAVRLLIDEGCLIGSIKVPNAAAPLDIEVNLRIREVTTSYTVVGPRAGRPATRIGWFPRQLKDAPPTARIDVRYPHTKDRSSMLLRDAMTNPQMLPHPTNPKREPWEFSVAWARPMGIKRGKLAGSIVGDTRGQAIEFYRTILQTLRLWVPPAPKLAGVAQSNEGETAPVGADDSTGKPGSASR